MVTEGASVVLDCPCVEDRVEISVDSGVVNGFGGGVDCDGGGGGVVLEGCFVVTGTGGGVD